MSPTFAPLGLRRSPLLASSPRHSTAHRLPRNRELSKDFAIPSTITRLCLSLRRRVQRKQRYSMKIGSLASKTAHRQRLATLLLGNGDNQPATTACKSNAVPLDRQTQPTRPSTSRSAYRYGNAIPPSSLPTHPIRRRFDELGSCQQGFPCATGPSLGQSGTKIYSRP